MTTEMPSRAVLLWTAQQVVRQHDEPPDPDRLTGRCKQCTPQGCAMVEWAHGVLTPHLVRIA